MGEFQIWVWVERRQKWTEWEASWPHELEHSRNHKSIKAASLTLAITIANIMTGLHNYPPDDKLLNYHVPDPFPRSLVMWSYCARCKLPIWKVYGIEIMYTCHLLNFFGYDRKIHSTSAEVVLCEVTVCYT